MFDPMRAQSLLSVFLLISAPLVSMSAIAQPADIDTQCNAAIEAGKTRIKGIPHLTLIQVNSWRDVSQDYSGLKPDQKPLSYAYIVKGAGLQTVASSPIFMSAISTNIINNCPTVSMIRFGTYASGPFITYGLMPDGAIKAFECLGGALGEIEKPAWGKVYC
ncbi:MAG: hypothetical protein ACFCU8_09875 [Thermosynechococcaceae cyanobacterium]